MIESPIERLAMTNPDLEIWWDSSPLVYPDWTRKMLENAEPDRWDLSKLRHLTCGGSAPPASLIRWYWETLGIEMIQAWGMTETQAASTYAMRPVIAPHDEGHAVVWGGWHEVSNYALYGVIVRCWSS